MCVEGRGDTLTPKLYAELCQLRSSTSKNSNFELSTKCILIKNLSLIKQFLNLIFLPFLFYFILFHIFLFISFIIFCIFFNFYFFIYIFIIFLFYFIFLFLIFLIYKYIFF